MSEVHRYEFDENGVCYRQPDAPFVSYDDYASLKAEVERLTRKLEVADNHAQCLEMVINAGTANELRIKAEVERLTSELSNITGWGRGLESDLSHARVEISFLKAEVERLSAADSYLQDANEHAFEKRCDELEAEVERLNEDNRQLTKVLEIAEGIIKRMGKSAEDAAKEGKPSV